MIQILYFYTMFWNKKQKTHHKEYIIKLCGCRLKTRKEELNNLIEIICFCTISILICTQSVIENDKNTQ